MSNGSSNENFAPAGVHGRGTTVAMPPQTQGTSPEARGPASSIGKSIVLKGELHSQEDLVVNGKVEGKVEMPGRRLTVGRSGDLQAGIKARDADVSGKVRGNIELDGKLTLRKEATLVGDLKTAAISIEDGAYFKGTIDIVRPRPTPACT